MNKLLSTPLIIILIISNAYSQTFIFDSKCLTGKDGQGNGNYSIKYNLKVEDFNVIAWSKDSEIAFSKNLVNNDLRLYTPSHMSSSKLAVTIPGANAKIKLEDDTKTILGYKCKKGTAKLGKIKMEFFYTEEVQVNSGVFIFKDSHHVFLKNQDYFDIKNLPGFVLEYRIEIPYFGTIVSKAIDLEELESFELTTKEIYQTVSLDEYFDDFREYHLPFEKRLINTKFRSP